MPLKLSSTGCDAVGTEIFAVYANRCAAFSGYNGRVGCQRATLFEAFLKQVLYILIFQSAELALAAVLVELHRYAIHERAGQ